VRPASGLTPDELELLSAIVQERWNSLTGLASVWPVHAERQRKLGKIMRKLEWLRGQP